MVKITPSQCEKLIGHCWVNDEVVLITAYHNGPEEKQINERHCVHCKLAQKRNSELLNVEKKERT